MTYSQKWTLVAFTHQIPIGTSYNMRNWPPHITLADVFAADFDGTELNDRLHSAISNILSFNATVQGNGQLGDPASPIDVSLFERSTELIGLHNAIIDVLVDNKAAFNTPQYTRDGFLPHITIQDKMFLKTGEEIEISSVTLVDMFPDQDWQERKVVDIYRLKEIG